MKVIQLLLVFLGIGIFLFCYGIASRYGRKIAEAFHIEYIFYIGGAACFSGIGTGIVSFALTDFPKIFLQFFC